METIKSNEKRLLTQNKNRKRKAKNKSILTLYKEAGSVQDKNKEEQKGQKINMTLNEKIARINALYKKSQAEGLTEEERKEQALLRSEYAASVRDNLRSQLNNINIQNDDGSIENLGEKYGKNWKQEMLLQKRKEKLPL